MALCEQCTWTFITGCYRYTQNIEMKTNMCKLWIYTLFSVHSYTVSISFQGPSYLVFYRMLTLCTKVHLFVWVFRSTREFFSQMEMLPLPSKGSKFCLMHWAFFYVPNLLWHGASSPKTRDSHTCCGAFSKGTVNHWFYDLCLSQLGFEHSICRKRGEKSYSTNFSGWK